LKRYRSARDKHQRFCHEKRIDDWRQVDRKHLLSYASWLEEQEYSESTTYTELTLVKQLVKWLIEQERRLPESHRIHLPLHRSNESHTYCWSSEEVQAMRELCREDPEVQWIGDVVQALATTGMRISELANLRWGDVDLTNNTLSVVDNRSARRSQKGREARTTKGKRSRRVPIHPSLRALLLTLRKTSDGYVFHGPKGGRLKPDTVRKALVRHVIDPLADRFPTHDGDVGFVDGRLHSFRHYFVSQAFLGGASEGEIREWVGHTDSRIVERYRHLRDEEAQRKMARIDFLGDAKESDRD
jgi:integrase